MMTPTPSPAAPSAAVLHTASKSRRREVGKSDQPMAYPGEESAILLYGGIDLHANNSVVVWLNEQDQVMYQQRFANHFPTMLEQCRAGTLDDVMEQTELA